MAEWSDNPGPSTCILFIVFSEVLVITRSKIIMTSSVSKTVHMLSHAIISNIMYKMYSYFKQLENEKNHIQ